MCTATIADPITLHPHPDCPPELTLKKERRRNNGPKFNDYISRDFLNLPEYDQGARIRATFGSGFYRLKINDCQFEVELHGTIQCQKQYENAMYKMNTLIAHIQGLQAHIQKEYEREKERIPASSAKKKNPRRL